MPGDAVSNDRPHSHLRAQSLIHQYRASVSTEVVTGAALLDFHCSASSTNLPAPDSGEHSEAYPAAFPHCTLQNRKNVLARYAAAEARYSIIFPGADRLRGAGGTAAPAPTPAFRNSTHNSLIKLFLQFRSISTIHSLPPHSAINTPQLFHGTTKGGRSETPPFPLPLKRLRGYYDPRGKCSTPTPVG